MEVKSAAGRYPVICYPEVDGVFAAIDRIAYKHVVCASWLPFKGLVEFSKHDIGENDKTMNAVMSIVDDLVAANATKNTTLVAVGGGVIQDVCTMAAHIYRRGMPLVLVPTTLMAMADSCIGSKCGINVDGFKNQVGCFHPPEKVLLCTEFTRTQNDDQIKSGFGEILKLALIGNSFNTLAANVASNGLRASIAGCVQMALEVKRNYIEADEFEKGRRVILNYGHTFGHALEATMQVPHGIAVAWGIDVVNYINCRRLKFLADGHYRLVKDFIRQHLRWSEFATDPDVVADIMEAVGHDKKAITRDGNIGLVVMDRPGEMHVVPCPLATVRGWLADYLQTENVFA